jgi:hypothetical protein
MMDVDDDDDVFDAVWWSRCRHNHNMIVVRIVVAVLTCRLLSYFVLEYGVSTDAVYIELWAPAGRLHAKPAIQILENSGARTGAP